MASNKFHDGSSMALQAKKRRWTTREIQMSTKQQQKLAEEKIKNK